MTFALCGGVVTFALWSQLSEHIEQSVGGRYCLAGFVGVRAIAVDAVDRGWHKA